MKNKKFAIKAFAINIAISFFFASVFVLVFYAFFYDKTTYYTNLINTTAISGNKTSEEKEIVLNKDSKRLTDYPAYGKKYATLKISAIDLELPLYYGDTLSILRYGVGQYAGSYFPGEGGTTIIAAHNTTNFFARVEELKVNDEIIIEASYGTFKYRIDSYKVVNENDLDAFPIQDEKELLILYTCYPINRSVIGRKTDRYVIYASLVGDSYE